MGRVKLKIKRLESVTNRNVTYSKRRNGILKKARELSILCDVDILLVMFSPNGKATIFQGERSTLEEVIMKYAQASPQDRAKRKLESLEALKKTFKKLDHDVNIEDFLGISTQTAEGLTEQIRMLQSQLSDTQRRLCYWINPNMVDSLEHIGMMEESVKNSIARLQLHKENINRQLMMSLECNQFQNNMMIPLMMNTNQPQWMSGSVTDLSYMQPQREIEYTGEIGFMNYQPYYIHEPHVKIEDIGQSSGTFNDVSTFGAYNMMAPSGTFNMVGPSGAYYEVSPCGAFSQVGPSGAFSQVGPSGAFSQVGPGGAFSQVGPSGAFSQVGPSGAFNQVGPSGTYNELGTMGPFNELGGSGAFNEMGAGGMFHAGGSGTYTSMFNEVGASGGFKVGTGAKYKEIASSMFNEVSSSAAFKEVVDTSDAFKEVGTSGIFNRVGASGIFNRVVATSTSNRVATTGTLNEMATSSNLNEMGTSNTLNEGDPSGEYKETGTNGTLNEVGASDALNEAGGSAILDQVGASKVGARDACKELGTGGTFLMGTSSTHNEVGTSGGDRRTMPVVQNQMSGHLGPNMMESNPFDLPITNNLEMARLLDDTGQQIWGHQSSSNSDASTFDNSFFQQP